MANKKKGFVTDGMTVDQILKMGDDQLSRLNKRELSRALRTVSLAANKRIGRLLSKADIVTNEMGDIKYVDKSGKGIDFEALYYTGGKKFGKGKSADRNQIYKEFARVRGFMNAKSTTIKGAIELRKKREKALFGKIHEDMNLTEAQTANLNDFMGDVYSEFHKWKEEYEMQGGYDKQKGKRVLKMLARRMHDKGMSGEDARKSVSDYYDAKYERTETASREVSQDLNPMNLLSDENTEDWRNW